MEKVKGIYNKLLAIQKSVMGLSKDKDGEQGKYKYVTGDKLLDYIKPLMNEQGLLLKQEIISIDNTRQDYATKFGSKSEILAKVMMRFTWVDCESGAIDENLFGANGQNNWDKGVGSALTYAERYFILKYFHIATDEDDIDNPEANKTPDIPILQTAINEMEVVATIDDLKTVWTRYKSLQTDKKFSEIKDKRKKELEAKGE